MPRGYRLIEVGVLAEGLTLAAYGGCVILILFAVNYGNLYLFAAGVAAAVFGLIGQRFTDMTKTLVVDKRSTAKILSVSWWYVLWGMAIMGVLDVFVPRYFSVNIVGFQLYPVLSGISLTSVVQIGLVFTIVEAIMEEVLARGGVTNAATRFTDEPMAAVVVSAAFFGIIHIPAYGFSVVILLLSFAGGMFAVFDLRSGDLLTSIIFHVTNNVIAWSVSAVAVGVSPATVVAVLMGHGLFSGVAILAKEGRLSVPKISLGDFAPLLLAKLLVMTSFMLRNGLRLGVGAS